MNWIKKIFGELFGLFVDDGAFALAILVWLGIIGCASFYFGFSSIRTAGVLFVGLALILIESTIRYARRQHTEQK